MILTQFCKIIVATSLPILAFGDISEAVTNDFDLLYAPIAKKLGTDEVSQTAKNVSVVSSETLKSRIELLSAEDRIALESFLRQSLTKSEAGYVLLGIKPIWWEGFYADPPYLKRNYSYRSRIVQYSEINQRGISVWNQLFLPKSEGPIVFVCYNKPNYHGQWRHFVWIHKKAFLDVVNNNLSLFQSILGPQLTAQGLLEKVSNSDESLVEALAENEILIGIVLGYGTKNAIAYNRERIIQEKLLEEEKIPLFPRYCRCGFTEPMFPSLLRGDWSQPKEDELQPSFGYSNIRQEFESIQNQLVLSQTLLSTEGIHIPLFGCLKDTEETAELLRVYGEAQKKIQKLVSSDSFLEEVIFLLDPVMKPIEDSNKISLSKGMTHSIPRCELASEIGNGIFNKLLEKDDLYVSSAIKGMQAAEKDTATFDFADFALEQALTRPIFKYQFAKKTYTAKNNTAAGTVALQSIANKTDTQELIPHKLYYRIKEKGNGPQFCLNDSCITVQFAVTVFGGALNGRLLASDASFTVDVAELIPGMVHGMLGMKIEEIREIYIHPDYGYGFCSNFDPGMALTVKVKLFSIEPPKKQHFHFPLLKPVDQGVEVLGHLASEEELEDLKIRAAFAEGYNAWLFYKSGNDLYSLQDVVENIQKGFQTKSPNKEITVNLHKMLYDRVLKIHHENDRVMRSMK